MDKKLQEILGDCSICEQPIMGLHEGGGVVTIKDSRKSYHTDCLITKD